MIAATALLALARMASAVAVAGPGAGFGDAQAPMGARQAASVDILDALFDPSTFDADEVPSEHEWRAIAEEQDRELCFVPPSGDDGDDDALAIAKALNGRCSEKSIVVLPGPLYHMRSNMTTTDLRDVRLHVFGRLLWSTDIDYWLSVSMPVGFQNQSTVWYFGGDDVVWDGHGVGTLDGNGQVWYDWARGEGNLPRRPMMINWRGFTNSVVRRQRFVQSQMWTMATTWSSNLLFEDIYVNNTSNSVHSTLNTDGIDTIWTDNVTLNRWDVTCGDDNVALKRNSTNIFLYDSVFHHGQGIAIGSLAQYNNEIDIVDTFVARGVHMTDTTYAIYLKTWGGNSTGYPPNGGGGGLGHATNILVEDIVLDRGRNTPFFLWQCENYEGSMGEDCHSSKFSFSNLAFRRVSGTMRDDVVAAAKFRCSAAAGGCHDVEVDDFSVTNVGSDEILDQWWCENVHGASGFSCIEFPPEEVTTLENTRPDGDDAQ
jgi:hypothetical protein